MLKTAVATLTSDTTEVEANVLFDEGSQRSFITEDLARALSLTPHHKEDVHLSSFGSRQPLNKTMEVAHINIKTIMGATVPISVLIVPTIATPLRNTVQTSVTQLPHLYGLQLAHPITREDSFKISLLIGTDHYWDLVEDHIVRGNGPTAMSSKLGYLLSGPLPIEDSTTPTHTNSFTLELITAMNVTLNSFGNWNQLALIQIMIPTRASWQNTPRRVSAVNQMVHTVPSCHGNPTIPHYHPIVKSAGRKHDLLYTVLLKHQSCYRPMTR